MATIINAPVKAHGDVTYPKLRVVLDSLQFTLDSIITGTITPSRVVVTDASGLLTTSTTTTTELGYVGGVTSAIQTQLDTKATKALNNLASTAVNADIIPASNNVQNLGTTSLKWSNVYSVVLTTPTLNTGSATNLSIQRNANEKINVGQSASTLSGGWTIATDGETSTQARLSINAPTSNNGQLIFLCADNGGQRNITITNAAIAGSRAYTLPEVGADASFVMTAGTQTIGGAKTFSSGIAIGVTSAHLVLATSSNSLTIQANAQATTTRVWSVPDISGNGTFAALEGTQTFSGAKTFSALLTPTAGIKGVSTNSNATAGNVGEYIQAVNGSSSNFPSTSTYGDANSLALTAGDWDVTFILVADRGSATWSRIDIGISPNTGNDSSGLTLGTNFLISEWPNSATTPVTICFSIPSYRLSLSGSATYYGKIRATFSAGTPQYFYRLSARRVQPGS